MSQTECTGPLELFPIGRQQVTLSFDGGDVVSDAGLLALRQLDRELGILAEAARRLPDPRAALFVVHSTERILTQQVYQILAGYPGCHWERGCVPEPWELAAARSICCGGLWIVCVSTGRS